MGDIESSRSLNRYAYCEGNPVRGVYYRTMSQSDYDYLRMTGETFISPTKAFSSDYNAVMVRFELNDGTTSMLIK